jgi:hypothetical protein
MQDLSGIVESEIALRENARRILTLAQDNALSRIRLASATWKSYAFWAKGKLTRRLQRHFVARPIP